MQSKQDADQQLAAVVDQAREGDRAALEQVVKAIQDPVYGLALRMLGVPAEAEDATQEILVKVITRLDSFRGESRFTTWVYAVAANHLRSLRTSAWHRRYAAFEGQSFDQMIERQAEVLPAAQPPAVESEVMTREIRLLCLHGALVSLDRESRLAFVLADTLELSGTEGAQALGIRPAAFRKRLSRARAKMKSFFTEHCGLVRGSNPCRCELWCDPGVAVGAIDPEQPLLADEPGTGVDQRELETQLSELDELARIRALWDSLPSYRAPGRLVEDLSALLNRQPSG